ncbi:chromate efflux transporter [Vibrio viridaestus]|uniref:Chromate efflux transporter n=1 Tax=Vibrio viridaestus TaxID=2487322 RepID=A0A3N9TKC9_9VIBR|nr:chromate efflux transporter [Vibrio viridaestus]RQW64848.1 chromate efflux transporter [Vibrio viridaestus]
MLFSIFRSFFTLGWISFGGPAAHIGYFRREFVEVKAWITDKQYADLVGLSQFLPGPGSSQVGFGIGYIRGGVLGGISAFLGFTLPSILLMLLFATVSSHFLDSTVLIGLLSGLKLLAVIVVADATWGMFRSFCQSNVTKVLFVFSAVITLTLPSTAMQIFAMLGCAIVSIMLTKAENTTTSWTTVFSKIAYTPLILFLTILLGVIMLDSNRHEFIVFKPFFETGTLVFGGGHVVLPLLESSLENQISPDIFLSGYAMAQAVPGPMFTLATYLGYFLLPSNPIIGALLATLAIFIPGFLLLLTMLKNWQEIALIPWVSGAMSGINAAVVGFLLATLYDPVITSSVKGTSEIALVVIGFILMRKMKLPILITVLFFALSGVLFLK